LLLAARHDVTEATIGWFFMYIGAIAVVTRAFILGRMVDRFGEVKLSHAGLVLLGVGLALMPLAPDRITFALVTTLVPLGTAFTFPCVTAMLSQVISPRERGLYMGVQQTFGGAARVVAPICAGFAWDHLGHGVPFWVGAAFILSTLFLGKDIEPQQRRRADARAVVAD
jgi:MFS family permease